MGCDGRDNKAYSIGTKMRLSVLEERNQILIILMSRSRRNTKIIGITTAKSEKQDKREANRKFRRITKQLIKKRNWNLPKLRELSNVWAFAKDGKMYRSTLDKKYLRK